jgi:hypothetical protein
MPMPRPRGALWLKEIIVVFVSGCRLLSRCAKLRLWWFPDEESRRHELRRQRQSRSRRAGWGSTTGSSAIGVPCRSSAPRSRNHRAPGTETPMYHLSPTYTSSISGAGAATIRPRHPPPPVESSHPPTRCMKRARQFDLLASRPGRCTIVA